MMASSLMESHHSSLTSSMKMSLHPLNEKLEDLRLRLNEPTKKLSNEEILLITTELQPLYKKLIIHDLEGAIQRQLETFMWNDCFKTPLTHFGRNDMSLFHFMIEGGVAFYLGFIQDVGIYYDIGFIKNTHRSLYCTAPVAKTILKTCSSKSSVYYIIQNSLIHVGDLLRYRGSFTEALKMYDKSTALCPSNGHPFNQMGLVQMLIDNKSVDSLLAAIYYYARAVSVTNPYVAAQHSLDNILTKLKSLAPSNKLEDFTHHFLMCIANPESLMFQQSSSPSLVTMLSPLITNGAMNTNQLFRIIVVALWAWRRESNKSLLAVDSSSENCMLEIIAAIINSLLIAAVAFPDLTTFYALAHLKILMDWLRVNSSVLNNPAFRSKLHTPTLCKFFNQLLTLENNVCGLKTKEIENIILPEEKRLLGFLPFCRTFDNLNCVMEDTDSRAVWIRIYRTLKCADNLSESRLGFLERSGPHGEYSEVPLATQVPSGIRRNVALQSIFNLSNDYSAPRAFSSAFSSPRSGESPYGVEPALPVSSKTLEFSDVNAAVGSGNRFLNKDFSSSYYLENGNNNNNTFNDNGVIVKGLTEYSPSSSSTTTTTSSATIINPMTSNSSPLPSTGLSSDQINKAFRSDFNSPDFSQLFSSIWSPVQPDTGKMNSDGWQL